MADYTGESGSAFLRKEVVDAMVKQTARASYKFKQACAIVSTNAWKNSFYREGTDVLSAGTRNAIKGIPRGANFPQAVPNWQEVTVRILKHGLEANIPWEDIISGDINIQARTIIRLTEAVVKSVDDDIWDVLSQTLGTGTPTVIQSFALGTGTNGGNWDQSSAAIVDNLMKASQLISTNGNYDVSNLICFVSPRDYRNIAKWVYDKGTQWDSLAEKIVLNGKVPGLAGMSFVESNSVTASYALVVKPKTCATFKELVSLRSTTEVDPYRSTMIRVVEEGCVELTDPLAVVLIKNTQAAP